MFAEADAKYTDKIRKPWKLHRKKVLKVRDYNWFLMIIIIEYPQH